MALMDWQPVQDALSPTPFDPSCCLLELSIPTFSEQLIFLFFAFLSRLQVVNTHPLAQVHESHRPSYPVYTADLMRLTHQEDCFHSLKEPNHSK